MGNDVIKVDSDSLDEFKQVFMRAGEEYKVNLAKLTNIINEIVRGDIQGTPADALKQKFEEKRDIFNSIAGLIDEGEQYLGIRGKNFSDMLSDVQGSMK